VTTGKWPCKSAGLTQALGLITVANTNSNINPTNPDPNPTNSIYPLVHTFRSALVSRILAIAAPAW